MATSKDWQVIQSATLYKLMKLEKKNANGVVPVKEIREIIGEIQASMTDDEIAQVEDKINKFVE